MNQYERISILIAVASLVLSVGNLTWLVYESWQERRDERPKIDRSIKPSTVRSPDGSMRAELWGYIRNHDHEPVSIVDYGLDLWRGGKLLDDVARSFELPRDIPPGGVLTFSEPSEAIACELYANGRRGEVHIRAFCIDSHKNPYGSNYIPLDVDRFACSG